MSAGRGATRARAVLALVAVLVAVGAVAGPAGAQAPPDAVNHPLLQPVDAQAWVDQAELTWAAYTPIRPAEWNSAETSRGSQSQYRTAIILMDFSDQPFLITQEAETHPFGNPQPGWQPVPQSEVAAWMERYYAEPNEFNGGQTLHAYWMEDSHGRIGVDVDVFGPYRMPGKSFEYGIASDFNTPLNQYCPQGHTCNRNIRTDGGNAWRAALGGCTGNCGYDNLFYVTAGHDESSTWQEFGEMLWLDRSEVPAAFGPPGATEGPVLNNLGQPMTNWANTRYVPWTSWRAAANHWPNASGSSSTQAESSGQSVFAHEFSHLRGLPDNYNNPFADNIRNFTGYWEMMSRGTFNGPGGTHNRWQVPNQGGSGLGPHHMLHYKNQLGVLTAADQITLQRDALADQGVAVVRIKSREHIPDGDLVGLTVNWGPAQIQGRIISPQTLNLSLTYMTNSYANHGRREARVVYAGLGTPAELAAADAQGAVVLMRRVNTQVESGPNPTQQVQNAQAAGAVAAIIHNFTTGTFTASVGSATIPAFTLSQAQGQAVLALVQAGPTTIELVGTGGDLADSCLTQGLEPFYCPGPVLPSGYLNYRLEVVDRIGNDSFAPGHGVLLAKSRNSGTPTVWLIDPKPQDIGMIDFYRPDGTPVPVVRGDPRQLNDATFHAGTRSGSEYEYVDTFNRLHFYVLAKHRDANGVLSYDVGVRRFDGAGPYVRGVSLAAPAKTARRAGFLATCTFPLTNTGEAGTGVFDSDVYRLSATSSSGDWEVTLPNALAAAKAGQTVSVPVHVLRNPKTEDGDARTTVTLAATSETDPSKRATRTCALHVRDTTPGG